MIIIEAYFHISGKQTFFFCHEILKDPRIKFYFALKLLFIALQVHSFMIISRTVFLKQAIHLLILFFFFSTSLDVLTEKIEKMGSLGLIINWLTTMDGKGKKY